MSPIAATGRTGFTRWAVIRTVRAALDAAERFCREDLSPCRYHILTRADLGRLHRIVPAYMPRMTEEMARDAKFVVEYTRLE